MKTKKKKSEGNLSNQGCPPTPLSREKGRVFPYHEEDLDKRTGSSSFAGTKKCRKHRSSKPRVILSEEEIIKKIEKAKSQGILLRRCTTCGQPTTNYRCPPCWDKVRENENFSFWGESTDEEYTINLE